MSFFVVCLSTLAFLAGSSLACMTDGSNPVACWGSSQVPSAFASYFASGDPCFMHPAGFKVCFTGEKNTAGAWMMRQCSCTNSGSGGSSGTTTTTTPAPNPCDNSKATSNTACLSTKQQYCDKSNYFKTYHTGCLYCGVDATECANMCDRGVSAAIQNTIVNKHNELRAFVAAGNETRGTAGAQPAASTMYFLKWNQELADLAQLWADRCLWEHDVLNDKLDLTSVGQNMAMDQQQVYKSLDQIDFANLVTGWYDEVADFNKTHVGGFVAGYDTVNGKTKAVGHYTQLVWGETKEIGCGIAQWHDTVNPLNSNFPYQTMLVCNYAKGGNMKGDAVYVSGNALSGCSSTTNNLCNW